MKKVKTSFITTIAIGLLTGSAAGAAAQDEAAAPVPEPFTGVIGCGHMIVTGSAEAQTFQTDEGTMVAQKLRGNTWQPVVQIMSDPRLEGTYTISFDEDKYFGSALEGGFQVAAGTWRIVNEEGAWQGSYHIFDMPNGEDVGVTVPLVGEGGYDGLTAIWEATFNDDPCWEVRGLIVEGELPAYPEPPAA